MDLVHPRVLGTIHNCIPRLHNELEQQKISLPARRDSTFEMMLHNEEGYGEGGWKYESTRLNQIRYYDQILNNKSNLISDGLTTLKFKTNQKTEDENYVFLSVNLDL